MEPARQRSTPSRSMYMVGSDCRSEWRRMSQSTRLEICCGALMILGSIERILDDCEDRYEGFWGCDRIGGGYKATVLRYCYTVDVRRKSLILHSICRAGTLHMLILWEGSGEEICIE